MGILISVHCLWVILVQQSLGETAVCHQPTDTHTRAVGKEYFRNRVYRVIDKTQKTGHYAASTDQQLTGGSKSAARHIMTRPELSELNNKT